MKFHSFLSILAIGASSVFATATETSTVTVPSIEIEGNKFYYSNNGTQFYIKGVAYQEDTSNSTSGYTSGLGESTFVDPLSDGDQCKRDIPYLLELDTNVIRVYAINTSLSHQECMDAFAEAGIYVISDLSQPSESINRADPEWTVELFDRYKSVVDALANYTNVLGFFAGNEVTNNSTNTDASAFVKAAVRDTKQYISDQGYRAIPVGYSANDDATTEVAVADYFACGSEEDRVDFYGLNIYSWCGNSTFQESGYDTKTEDFSNLTIPIFFSEYGCNEVQPREFYDVLTLYSDEMTDVWSGGIIYMYFQETNDYGLVSISDNDVVTLDDFNNLKSRMEEIDPTTATLTGTIAVTTMSCPAIAATWAASESLPPTPDEAVCDCLEDSLSCVVSSDVDSDDYGTLFGIVCGYIDCSQISTNATEGVYGEYSYCDDSVKLSFLLNKYYEENGSSSSACDFSGSATLTSASTVSTCAAVLSSASAGESSTGSSKSSTSGSATASSTSTSSSSSGAGMLKPATISSYAVFITISGLILGALGVSLI